MESFVQVFDPEGFAQSVPDTHPTKAPTDPLYLIPTGLIVSPSKVKLPSTYSSAVGSALILAKEEAGRVNSKVCSLSWSKIYPEPVVRYFSSPLGVISGTTYSPGFLGGSIGSVGSSQPVITKRAKNPKIKLGKLYLYFPIGAKVQVELFIKE